MAPSSGKRLPRVGRGLRPTKRRRSIANLLGRSDVRFNTKPPSSTARLSGLSASTAGYGRRHSPPKAPTVCSKENSRHRRLLSLRAPVASTRRPTGLLLLLLDGGCGRGVFCLDRSLLGLGRRSRLLGAHLCCLGVLGCVLVGRGSSRCFRSRRRSSRRGRRRGSGRGNALSNSGTSDGESGNGSEQLLHDQQSF